MGIILMLYIGAGVLCGIVADAALIGASIWITAASMRHRSGVMPVFALAGMLGFILLSALVTGYRWPTARPGSDYDIVAHSLFFQSLCYTASIGLAALFGALTTRTRLCAKTGTMPIA